MVDILEVQRVIWRKLTILTYPTCIRHLRWGLPRLSFAEIFRIIQLESVGYRVALYV